MEKTHKALEFFVKEELTYYPNFINFEGGEGSGKSTVLRQVAEKLEAAGYTVFITREPGGNGTDMAERIRQLILSDEMGGMTPMTEAFLYAAARTQHVQEVVKPRLEAGEIVLTDRYVDSSLVYQGYAWDNLATIAEINALAIVGVMPKTTLFFDVLPEEGIARVFSNRQDEINHLDARDMSFHQKIYEGYQTLEAFFTDRYVNIDASQALEKVVEDVYEQVLKQIQEMDKK